jgi:hypothetical protein
VSEYALTQNEEGSRPLLASVADGDRAAFTAEVLRRGRLLEAEEAIQELPAFVVVDKAEQARLRFAGIVWE